MAARTSHWPSTDVEGSHGKLSSGFPNGLSRNGSHRGANIH